MLKSDFICILLDFVTEVGFGEGSVKTSQGVFNIGLGCCGEGLPCEVEGRRNSVASPAANGAEPGLRVADIGGARTLKPEELRVIVPLRMRADCLVGKLWSGLLSVEDQGKEGAESLGVGGIGKSGRSRGDGRLLGGSSGGGVSASDS